MKDGEEKMISVKGFTKKWWQAHRAMACKGSGVGKALDACASAGIAPNGLPANVKGLPAVKSARQAYTKLHAALKTAKGKCGKLQAETAKGIGVYIKQTQRGERQLDHIEKVAQDELKKQEQGEKVALEAFKSIKIISDTSAKITPELEKTIKSIEGTLDGIKDLLGQNIVDFKEKKSKLMAIIKHTGFQEAGKKNEKLQKTVESLKVTYKKLPLKEPSLKKQISECSNVLKVTVSLAERLQKKYSAAMPVVTKAVVTLDKQARAQKSESV